VANDIRQKQLALIHLAKKTLGLDDETYRAMLERVTGHTSAALLDATGRQRVLDELRALGFRGGKVRRRARPSSPRAALVSKIRALLADQGHPDTYGDAIAKRMFGTDRVEWLEEDQLRKVVAALEIHRRRQQRQPDTSRRRGTRRTEGDKA
jgi:phage gp16-like protein